MSLALRTPFGSLLGPMLGHFWDLKWVSNRPRKRTENDIENRTPKGSQNWPSEGPRKPPSWPPNRPQTPPGPPWTPSTSPESLRKASGRPPGGLREASGRPPGSLRQLSGSPPEALRHPSGLDLGLVGKSSLGQLGSSQNAKRSDALRPSPGTDTPANGYGQG